MALFNKKQKKEKKVVAAPVAAPVQVVGTPMRASLAHILKHARVTEKATMHQGAGVYTFDIAEEATKNDIVKAVRAIYGVVPRKVAVVTIPSKTRRNARTGKSGVKHGGRKAYVYLKKGETITIG
jgi:large subunit ribosomal protein L23